MRYGPSRNPLCRPASSCFAWKRVSTPFRTSTSAARAGSGGRSATAGNRSSTDAGEQIPLARTRSRNAAVVSGGDTAGISVIT